MIKLYPFQEKAKKEIIDCLSKKDSVNVQAPTAAGKTVILSTVITEKLSADKNLVAIWFSPGSGELEEQSQEAFDRIADKYISKNLDDVLTTGFSENDVCFFNWEELVMTGNKALRESETKNLKELIDEAISNDINFLIIIDEYHLNDTEKSAKVLDLFGKNIKRVNASATMPLNVKIDVEVDVNDVKAAGLITKEIVLNDGIADIKELSSDDHKTLIDLAMEKRQKIHKRYIEKGIKTIVPLILVQYPCEKENSNLVSERIKEIDLYLNTKYGWSYETGEIGRYLDGDKINIGKDNKPNDTVKILHVKQAISTGWNCPRAKVLVKFRENSNERFNIQQTGRIVRMPELKHYNDPLLDNCFVYTFDKSYQDFLLKECGAKFGNDVEIKEECNIKLGLNKQTRNISMSVSGKKEIEETVVSSTIVKHNFEELDKTDTDFETKIKDNKEKLVKLNFDLSTDIRRDVVYGAFKDASELRKINEHTISIKESSLLQSKRESYRNALRIMNGHLNSTNIHTGTIEKICNKLFLVPRKRSGHEKDGLILQLNESDYFVFVVNNKILIERFIKEAIHEAKIKSSSTSVSVYEEEFVFPPKDIIKIDNSKSIEYFKKNIYDNYPKNSVLIHSSVKSNVEKTFENWLEENENVKYWYKNGDKGPQYFSIVYNNSLDSDYLFYPDYIYIDKNGDIWIAEAKGGWKSLGESKNIDKDESPDKFDALKSFVEKNNSTSLTPKLHFMFVRDNENSDGTIELLGNNTKYTEEKSASWKSLSDIA